MTAMRPSRIALLLAVALTTVAGGGCRKEVDPVTTLEPVDVVTGWFDAGIVSGKNKLVPSVSLKLRNKSSDQVRSVQVNAIFRRVGEMEMWGEHFTMGVPREGLAPGEVTKELVLQSAARLHRRATPAAVAAEQPVRGREGRTLPETGIADLVEAR